MGKPGTAWKPPNEQTWGYSVQPPDAIQRTPIKNQEPIPPSGLNPCLLSQYQHFAKGSKETVIFLVASISAHGSNAKPASMTADVAVASASSKRAERHPPQPGEQDCGRALRLPNESHGAWKNKFPDICLSEIQLQTAHKPCWSKWARVSDLAHLAHLLEQVDNGFGLVVHLATWLPSKWANGCGHLGSSGGMDKWSKWTKWPGPSARRAGPFTRSGPSRLSGPGNLSRRSGQSGHHHLSTF